MPEFLFLESTWNTDNCNSPYILPSPLPQKKKNPVGMSGLHRDTKISEPRTEDHLQRLSLNKWTKMVAIGTWTGLVTPGTLAASYFKDGQLRNSLMTCLPAHSDMACLHFSLKKYLQALAGLLSWWERGPHTAKLGSGHRQESTSECINTRNNKSMFLSSPALSLENQ